MLREHVFGKLFLRALILAAITLIVNSSSRAATNAQRVLALSKGCDDAIRKLSGKEKPCETLEAIAKSDPDPTIRTLALKAVMERRNLLWSDSEWATVIDKVVDQTLLARLALELSGHGSTGVRALSKMTDQVLLANTAARLSARGDKAESMFAIRKITDQRELALIAMGGYGLTDRKIIPCLDDPNGVRFPQRRLAASKLDDQLYILRVAEETHDPVARASAVCQMDDAPTLLNLAVKDEAEIVRSYATLSLAQNANISQALLSSLALTASVPNAPPSRLPQGVMAFQIKAAAVRRLWDQPTLRQILQEPPSGKGAQIAQSSESYMILLWAAGGILDPDYLDKMGHAWSFAGQWGDALGDHLNEMANLRRRLQSSGIESLGQLRILLTGQRGSFGKYDVFTTRGGYTTDGYAERLHVAIATDTKTIFSKLQAFKMVNPSPEHAPLDPDEIIKALVAYNSEDPVARERREDLARRQEEEFLQSLNSHLLPVR